MHVVWDEDNLKQNEEIQKEYSAVRISEPKTPYRPPLPSDSLEDDMKPLQLDEGAYFGRNSSPSSTAAAAAATGSSPSSPACPVATLHPQQHSSLLAVAAAVVMPQLQAHCGQRSA
jgi:hypothetical protein